MLIHVFGDPRCKVVLWASDGWGEDKEDPQHLQCKAAPTAESAPSSVH
jgi:hypothetical protein